MKLLLLAPLRLEARAVRRVLNARVLRTGMGPARARIAAARGLAVDAQAVAVVGVCGAVAPELRAGDVVCATELRAEGMEPIAVPGSALLAAALQRRGLRVHVGPIISTDHIVGPRERETFREQGVLAVDMESAWLAAAAGERPFAVVRVVLDAAGRSLFDPRTIAAGVRALRNLRRAGEALTEWYEAFRAVARSADMVLVVTPKTSSDLLRRDAKEVLVR